MQQNYAGMNLGLIRWGDISPHNLPLQLAILKVNTKVNLVYKNGTTHKYIVQLVMECEQRHDIILLLVRPFFDLHHKH